MQSATAHHAWSASLVAGVLAACCGLQCGCGGAPAGAGGGPGGGPAPSVAMERLGLSGQAAASTSLEPSLERGAWVPADRLAALLDGVDTGERTKPRIVIEKPGDSQHPEVPAGQHQDGGAGEVGSGEGLEAAPGWSSTSWSAPVKIETRTSPLAGMQGKVLLLAPLPSAPEPSPPAAGAGKLPQKVVVALALPLPKSGGKADRIHARAGGPGRLSLQAAGVGTRSVALALAVESGPERTYYESPALVLPPGAARELAISLAAKTWKCAASAWKFSAAVAPGRLRRIFILIYEPVPGTRVIIDRLRLARRAPRVSP